MAITNAQQYQQLVNKPANGKRPGYRGDAASIAAEKREAETGQKSSRPGPGPGETDRRDAGDNFDRESFQRARDIGEANRALRILEEDKAEEKVERFRNKQFQGLPFPGVTSILNPLFKKGMTVNRNFFLDKVLAAGKLGITPEEFANLSLSQQEDIYSNYMSNRLSGEIDAYGNPLMRGDDGPDPIPFIPPVEDDTEKDIVTPVRNLGGLTARIGGGLFNFDGPQFAADGGRIGFRIGSESGKDTSGRDYASDTAASRSVRTSPSRDTGGGGDDNNNQPPQKIKLPEPVKTGIDTYNNIKYLQNLKNFNPQGIMFDLGKQFLIDKFLSEANTEEDQNMQMAELSQKQLNYLNSPKGKLDLELLGPKDVFENRLPLYENKPFFGPNQEPTTPEEFNQYLDSIGMKRMTAAAGGIAGLDREAFLLGGIAKGLKKAVRGVKKIAKSPIGKAALLGIGGGFMGIGPFKGLATAKGLGFKNFMLNKVLGTPLGDITGTRTGGLLGLIKDNPMSSIFLASLAAGAMTSKQDDGFNIDQYYADNKLNPNAPLNKRIAGSEFDFYGGQTAADGGRIGYQEGSKEPVAKKTLPLIDMDGMEKDYRETGGFVEMGRMEKADDVPARLSKNEFVFTADAVRNAGEGDIDKGAEVMYNMMKNLEAGGEVSEESQGLEGAREMFQTSQRLGEVI